FGKPVRVNRVGSMFTVFFTDKNVTDFDSAKTCDVNRFNVWFHFMLNQGIYLSPSQFEAAFISAAHSEDDIDRTIASASRALHDGARTSRPMVVGNPRLHLHS